MEDTKKEIVLLANEKLSTKISIQYKTEKEYINDKLELLIYYEDMPPTLFELDVTLSELGGKILDRFCQVQKISIYKLK